MENQTSADSNGAYAKQLVEGMNSKGFDNISNVLRDIPGNDACAECGAPEPQWASLNLGILVCIECSGVHRNLGVHISKVRSLTLDVKVWEPTIIDLFSALGNAYCNSVWEELLLTQNPRIDDHTIDVPCIKKPTSKDILLIKEKYIHSKYVDKSLIVRESIQSDPSLVNIQMWEAVKTKNVKMAYGLLVASNACPNSHYDEVNNELHHTVDTPTHENNVTAGTKQLDPALCQKLESGEADSCFQGCSLLHLACHVGDPVMVELLLQFGADINFQDIHGRTPLHHCISLKNDSLAKYLIRRGAITSIKDGGEVTALERAMELGAITDEELFILLAGR